MPYVSTGRPRGRPRKAAFIPSIVRSEPGVLRIGVFQRPHGWELVGMLQKPGREPSFSSHGIYRSKEMALEVGRQLKEDLERRSRNPSRKPMLKKEFLGYREKADSINDAISKLSEEEINPKRNPEGSLYESFHGTPGKTRKVTYNPPKGKLVAIGKLIEVIYKPYGSSQRKGVLFTHKAGDTGEEMLESNSILATSEDGKELYIIKDREGEYPQFTKRGIIG